MNFSGMNEVAHRLTLFLDLGQRTRTNNKLNPQPGPHWWVASAPTTAPSLLSSNPQCSIPIVTLI